MSRAYYACFLVARKVAFDNCGLEARKRASIRAEKGILHEPLQRYFKNSSEEGIRVLGEALAGLHGSRKDADYTMSGTVTSKDAESAIDDAQEFLDALARIQPGEVGRAMQEDIDRTF